jgi:hypothetical protein
MTSLANKSVVFVGDSINNLIFRAGLCEAAKTFTVADLKAFHAQVLDTGALPMDVLDAKIKRWIAAAK